ncbi:MAG: hypothetical protein ABI036_12935 [Fibrobacteria bacterium]
MNSVMSTIKSYTVVFVALFLSAIGISSYTYLSPQYLKPWHKDYAQKFADPRLQLAAHGILAANGHNMQPWKINLDPDANVFYLFADGARLTPEVDPLLRQTMVSQGTFLEYLSVAGKQLGYKVDIVLFPDGEYDENNLASSINSLPVAKITLAKTKPIATPLYDCLFLADTNRSPYLSTPLTEEQVRQIIGIHSDSIVTLSLYQSQEDLKKLGGYANAGTKIESGLHRMNVESANIFRATEREKNAYRYGFSVEGQGTSGVMKYILEAFITLFPSSNNEAASKARNIALTEAAVAHTPGYALIISKTNSRSAQVESGMLYSRLILTGHALGLVMQPTSQVLEEYPEMKEQYDSIRKSYAPTGGTIQMFVRLGLPKKEYPPTMRQDVLGFVIN